MQTLIRKQATALIVLLGLLLVFILPFTGVVYQLISEIDTQINFARQEIYGDAYLPPLWKLLQDIPQNQLLGHRYLSQGTYREEFFNDRAKIDSDFQELAQVDRQLENKLKTTDKINALQKNWQSIKEKTVQPSNTSDNYTQKLYNELINELRGLISYVGDNSNLILDPDLDSYYLMDSVMLKLPDIQEQLAQIRILSDDIVTEQSITPDSKAKLIVLAGLVAANMEALNKGMDVAFGHNTAQNIQPVLSKPLQNTVAATEEVLQKLKQEIINAQEIKVDDRNYNLLFTQTIQANDNFWKAALKELDGLLQARIDKFSSKKLLIEVFSGLVLVIAIWILIAFTCNLIERQRAEKALREAEEKYRSIVENSPDGIFQTTPDGNYISANSALARIYGYSSPNALKASVTDIGQQLYLNPNRRQEFKELMDKNDVVTEFESQIYRGDGSIIWISEDARSVRDASGIILYYEGTVKDITERKLSEEALQQSEERFRSLVDNIPGAVYRYRYDSDWKLEFISDVIEEISGYPATEFIDNRVRTLSSLIHGEDKPIVENAIRLGIADREPYVIEYRIYRLMDESIRWVGDKGQAIFDENGNVSWLDGAIFDITERKEEEALRESEARFRKQAQQLELALQELQQAQSQLIQTEKMSSLGQMVAGIAHEINNPVNFIHGNIIHSSQYIKDLLNLVHLYQQHYPNPVPEIEDEIEAMDLEFIAQDLPKMLASMKIGTNRICEIVLSLRNFSRLDEAEMKPVDIHEGIDSTLLILQNRLKAKGEQSTIQVIKEYGELPKVECYAGQLNQVFMNIIANAIDALECYNTQRRIEEIKENPSTITIRTAVLKPETITVIIYDNGPGMTEAVRKRLFDPFFTTKTVGKGTGLGLSISYSIVVKKHRGSIWCHSEPGMGTEFWVEIPVSQNLVAKTEEPQRELVLL